MSTIVVDIETVAFPWDNFDKVQQEYLLKFAEGEKEAQETIEKLSLYPLTARIVAIGMMNPDTGNGCVYYMSDETTETDIDGSRLVPGNEVTCIEAFWKILTNFNQIVTFNGRGFDCPFLMLRSAILQLTPQRNLMPYRYDAKLHCDLLDQLTYYGSVRKFNLDSYCKSFGIQSPKTQNVMGNDVPRLFSEGKFKEIATYCLGDVKATTELFKIWRDKLQFNS